jgi:hypothetical protein
LARYDKIFENDKLGIQSDVVGFAHIIEQEKYTDSVQSAKVYSISAEFGIGKTFFCDRLQEVLKLDNIPVAKMNIWEMDFYEDPLVPILIKIQEVYNKYHFTSNWVKRQIKCVVRFFATIFGRTIQWATQDTLFDFEKFIKQYKNLSQKPKIYGEYKQYEKELKSLKIFLKDWAKKAEKPIIIIIDELDRCRPDYAVKTLEVLKHFFDIPGFVFVLALDEEQLESSVKCLFGTENFDGYKRKFINNSFLLPKPDKQKFAEFLFDKSNIKEIIENIQKNKKELTFKINIYNVFHCALPYSSCYNVEMENSAKIFNETQISEFIIKQYFSAYSIWFKFTLRQMEQVFDRLVLFAKMIKDSDELFSPDLAVLLICLHEFDIKIYDKLRIYPNEITQVLSQIHSNNPGVPLASLVYQGKEKEMFDELDRTIIPPIFECAQYSCHFNDQPSREIVDNVDRFFRKDNQWLVERDASYTISNAIDNDSLITPSSGFDMQKFRQIYFTKMDFLSKFDKSLKEDS